LVWVSGHAIRYGLESAWIACTNEGLPSLAAVIFNQSIGGIMMTFAERHPEKFYSRDESSKELTPQKGGYKDEVPWQKRMWWFGFIY
jgi:hypothetical protein